MIRHISFVILLLVIGISPMLHAQSEYWDGENNSINLCIAHAFNPSKYFKSWAQELSFTSRGKIDIGVSYSWSNAESNQPHVRSGQSLVSAHIDVLAIKPNISKFPVASSFGVGVIRDADNPSSPSITASIAVIAYPGNTAGRSRIQPTASISYIGEPLGPAAQFTFGLPIRVRVHDSPIMAFEPAFSISRGEWILSVGLAMLFGV